MQYTQGCKYQCEYNMEKFVSKLLNKIYLSSTEASTIDFPSIKYVVFSTLQRKSNSVLVLKFGFFV